jgi:single-strand DNA-binding protein
MDQAWLFATGIGGTVAHSTPGIPNERTLMASLNRVLLIGNCTRDPELRYTPKGTPVAELDIAVNRTYSGDDGEKKEEVTYISITLWARLAEIAQLYLRKGSPLFVEGRLSLDQWDDKQTGQKRSRLRVVGENLQLLGQRPSAETTSASRPANAPPRPQPVSRKVEPPLDIDDDIPY